MKTRVAINGFGRIGRVFFRSVYNHLNIEVVAINDLADVTTMAHLLKYDSVHGQFDAHVRTDNINLIVDEKVIIYSSIPNPEQLSWKELDIDLVIEATGLFRTAESVQGHLTAGTKKVIVSSPPLDDLIPTVVMGINEHILSGDEQVIYSGINNSDLALNSLKTIALSDDLTAVLLQEVTYNSDTGMDEYSFEVLGVNREGNVTSSSSHH